LQQMQQAANQTQTSTTSSFSQMGSLGGGVVPALNSIAMGFGAIGAAATAAAVGGVAYFTNSAIQMSASFQQGIADIAAVMGETSAQVAPLADEIKKIAIDPNLKATLTETAAASDMLAKSGIHMADQLDGALRSTILLGNATGESFPLSAKVASAAMDAFGLSASQLPHVVDGITGVLNNSRMSLTDYNYMLANTGGRAKQFGIDLDTMNAIVVETRGHFNSGRTQGTAFSEMIRQMTAPTAKGTAAMNALGISLTDSYGRFKDIFQVIGDVNQAFKKLSQAEQAEAAQSIFGSSGGKMFFALAGQTEEKLQGVAQWVNASGQAAAAAATRMDTLSGKIEIFWGIIESAQLAFGDKFIPVLEAGLGRINNAASKLVMAFQGSGVSGIANLLGLSPETVNMIDKVESKLSSFVETVMNTGLKNGLASIEVDVQSLTIGFNALVGAAGGLLILGAVATGFAAVAFAMTPLGAAIIGLTTGAALLGAAWQTNFYGIQDTTAKLATTIYQLAVITKVGLNSVIQEFATYWENVKKSNAQGVAEIKGYIAPFYTWFASTTKSFYDWYLSTGVTLWGNINKVIDYAMSFFSKRVQDGMKQASEFVDYYAKYILSSVNSVIDSMNSIGANLPPAQVATAVAPVFDQPMFPANTGMGEPSFFASITAFTQSSTMPQYLAYIEQAKTSTTAFGQATAQTEPTFADYETNVLSSADSNKKLGQSAEQAAKQIENAKEKINDNGVNMANLRGEIQTLEAQYPGLTNEVMTNFNAHIAAGKSVASFGDQLGATERRQMFNYLAKLNDMDAANQALIASNGIVASSVVGTGDGFRDQYLTMATGLTPVVTATDALSLAVTNTTTTALPALATSLNETVTPAISTTGIAADTLANTQFSGLQSQVSNMLNPSLGQLFTQLSEQVAPALTQTGIRADEMSAAFQRAIDKNKLFFESNNLVIVSLKNERKAVEDLIKYYDELYKAKLRAANTSGATPAPAASGAPAPSQTFPQFARGGSFVVPSGYPTSSAGMGIGVHSGELVKVFTAQQTRQMKRLQANNHIVSSSNTTSDNSRVVNFNITTQQPSKSVLKDLAFAKAKYGVI